MKFRRRHRSRVVEAIIDVTSLIDAAFILIIFLLISTSFKKTEFAFTLNLPTATGEQIVVTSADHSVYVTRDGTYYYLQKSGASTTSSGTRTGQKLSVDELRRTLEQVARDTPDIVLSILAEQDTDYQRIVDAMNEASLAGIRNIQLPYDRPR